MAVPPQIPTTALGSGLRPSPLIEMRRLDPSQHDWRWIGRWITAFGFTNNRNLHLKTGRSRRVSYASRSGTTQFRVM